jgi:hypothetical protein
MPILSFVVGNPWSDLLHIIWLFIICWVFMHRQVDVEHDRIETSSKLKQTVTYE